jgi:hypothetical protein
MELFGRGKHDAINMTDDAVYEAMDKIVGEVCAVFQSTPYFHIGGDEVSLKGVGETPAEKTYMDKFGLADADDIYLHFISRMDTIVRKHGKTTLVWEGFKDKGSARVRIPDDLVVLAFETLYQRPDSLVNNGYTVINSSWKPLYITPSRKWDPEYIYGWNMFRWENWWDRAPSYVPIQLTPTGKVIGAEMCSWEMAEEMEIPAIRTRLAAFSERVWHRAPDLTYDNFRRRFLSTDARLTNLIGLENRSSDAAASKRPLYPVPLIQVEDLFHVSPPFAFPACGHGLLHRPHDGPPSLGRRIGGHLGHVTGEVRAMILEVTVEYAILQIDRVVPDIALANGFEHLRRHSRMALAVFFLRFLLQANHHSVSLHHCSLDSYPFACAARRA